MVNFRRRKEFFYCRGCSNLLGCYYRCEDDEKEKNRQSRGIEIGKLTGVKSCDWLKNMRVAMKTTDSSFSLGGRLITQDRNELLVDQFRTRLTPDLSVPLENVDRYENNSIKISRNEFWIFNQAFQI